MPVLRSQTVYLSITVTLASCRLLCHSNIRSCSLMCLDQYHAALALSCALLCLDQHHAALALSCALLCLSITSLMCLALSQHAITPLFSILSCPGYSIMSIAPNCTAIEIKVVH